MDDNQIIQRGGNQEDNTKREARELFDSISRYFMTHPEAPSGALLEAVDFVSNYLGDIAMSREYTPDQFSEAFPTVIQQTREEELSNILSNLPKERPMNVFSFHLQGEELEQYMRHKGFNECRSEVKDRLQSLNNTK